MAGEILLFPSVSTAMSRESPSLLPDSPLPSHPASNASNGPTFEKETRLAQPVVRRDVLQQPVRHVALVLWAVAEHVAQEQSVELEHAASAAGPGSDLEQHHRLDQPAVGDVGGRLSLLLRDIGRGVWGWVRGGAGQWDQGSDGIKNGSTL